MLLDILIDRKLFSSQRFEHSHEQKIVTGGQVRPIRRVLKSFLVLISQCIPGQSHDVRLGTVMEEMGMSSILFLQAAFADRKN